MLTRARTNLKVGKASSWDLKKQQECCLKDELEGVEEINYEKSEEDVRFIKTVLTS